jgi:hypothetical protein
LILKTNNMKIEAKALLTVIRFLYNKNISIVTDIYIGKVPNTIVAHLTDRAQRYRTQHNNNELGWIDFIRSLDTENLNILAEYVFNNK